MRYDSRIPVIRPINDIASRPVWSVMIPVYNCLPFLSQTLLSVLEQAPEMQAMEIVVVDDCSTDGNVQELVESIGKGRIRYMSQHQNVGSLRNFETCLNQSRGKYIHLLHGDDFVLPGYYKKMTELFERFPEAGVACCRIRYVGQEGGFLNNDLAERSVDGILENWLAKITRRQRLQYCAVSVRRDVYEVVGGFFGVHYGEDWEMWARIATKFPFAYSPEILACYRRHNQSISGHSVKNGQHIKDINHVIDTIAQYVPEQLQRSTKHAARKFYGRVIMTKAFGIWNSSKNRELAREMSRDAFKFSREPYLLWRRLWLEIKMRTGN